MKIKRHVERLHALPERIVARIIEINAVGVTVDHRTHKAELADATLQLVGGSGRVLHGEMRKTRIAIGPALHLRGQQVIGFARELDGDGSIPLDLDAGTGQRQDRELDTGCIHCAEPPIPEIRKLLNQLVVRPW